MFASRALIHGQADPYWEGKKNALPPDGISFHPGFQRMVCKHGIWGTCRVCGYNVQDVVRELHFGMDCVACGIDDNRGVAEKHPYPKRLRMRRRLA